jgi:hypothetical protein
MLLRVRTEELFNAGAPPAACEILTQVRINSVAQ